MIEQGEVIWHIDLYVLQSNFIIYLLTLRKQLAANAYFLKMFHVHPRVETLTLRVELFFMVTLHFVLAEK